METIRLDGLVETIEQKADQNGKQDEQLANLRHAGRTESGLLFANFHVGLLEENLVDRMNDTVDRVDVRALDVCVNALPFEEDLRTLHTNLDLAS